MMDARSVRLESPEWERKLPHFSDLDNLYRALGSIVADSVEFLDPAEDALAEKIITRNPAFEPEGPLFQPLVEALTAAPSEADGDIEQQSTTEAGIAIATHILDNAKNTRGIITGYLNACFEVDRLKIGLCGFNGAINQEHGVLFVTRQALMDDIPPNERSEKIAANVGQAIHQLGHYDNFFGWFMPKIQLMHQEIAARSQSKQTAERMTPASQESIDAYGGADALRSDIAEFISRTMHERRYGVKAAYTEASFGGSWVYYDADDYTDVFPVDVDPAYAAIVFHTPLTELNDLKLESEVIEYTNTAKSHVVTGALAAMKPDARYVIGYDGELYADDALVEPVRRLLKDSPGTYESLQAELIANLYDLTAAGDTVVASRKPNVRTKPDPKQPYDPILQLLLPRLKKSYIGPEPEEQGSRYVREHDVTWFTRKLPAGWKASPDAVALAKRHNITLEPHETFVRQHKRGAGNAVAGHQIAHR